MWNVPTKERLSKIPKLYETETIKLQDKFIYLHFFFGGCDWFIAEYDDKELFWGYAILNNDYELAEWGYISFTELRKININGIEIDCELEEYFPVKKACEIEKICKGNRWEIKWHNQKKDQRMNDGNVQMPCKDPLSINELKLECPRCGCGIVPEPGFDDLYCGECKMIVMHR